METGLAIQLGASEEKRRADQYSYLTAVHCLSSSCRSKLALHTFQLCPAIPASQHYAEQRCCCSQQLATNFALLSFPLLSKGTSGSFLQNLRHLDEQLIYSSAQHFFLSLFCSSCHRAQFVQRSNPLRKQPVVQVSFHCSQQPLLIALLHDVSWKFRVGHTPPLLFFVFFFFTCLFSHNFA